MLCSVLTFAGLEPAPVRLSVMCIRPSSFNTKIKVENSSLVDALLCDGLFLISTIPSSESCFGLTDALILPRLPQGSVVVVSHLNLRVDSISQWSLFPACPTKSILKLPTFPPSQNLVTVFKRRAASVLTFGWQTCRESPLWLKGDQPSQPKVG